MTGSEDGRPPSAEPPDAPTAMNNVTGKRVLALVRGADYAHPGEEEANELLFTGILPDPRRRVLDAGCGGGGTAAWIQSRGLGLVTGIELDASTAGLARARHPDVTVVEGDVRRAREALTGPYDLVYAMTALYAVPEQAAVFRELRALAAPGGELRLFEYTDPSGGFAAATEGDPSWAWWRPLDPRELPETLSSAGWHVDAVRDLHPEFVHWYRQLCEGIAAHRQEITREFGQEWYEFAAREYAGILQLTRSGNLGGVLVRAHTHA